MKIYLFKNQYLKSEQKYKEIVNDCANLFMVKKQENYFTK